MGYPYDMNGIALDHQEKVGILAIYCWYIQGILRYLEKIIKNSIHNIRFVIQLDRLGHIFHSWVGKATTYRGKFQKPQCGPPFPDTFHTTPQKKRPSSIRNVYSKLLRVPDSSHFKSSSSWWRKSSSTLTLMVFSEVPAFVMPRVAASIISLLGFLAPVNVVCCLLFGWKIGKTKKWHGSDIFILWESKGILLFFFSNPLMIFMVHNLVAVLIC